MRKIARILVALLATAGAASAQIPTSGNIFVGYPVSQTRPYTAVTLNGWEGSLEGKFLPWVSSQTLARAMAPTILLDRLHAPLSAAHPLAKASEGIRTFLGRAFQYPSADLLPLCMCCLAQLILMTRKIQTLHSPARLIKGVAWRVQADDLHTNFFGTGENHFRFSTGIDIRF